MPDRRLGRPLGKIVTVHCGYCDWSLWREDGFTRKQAFEAVKRHHYRECPDPFWVHLRNLHDATTHG